MSGILSTRLFELPTPLLVLPGVSSAQVSWRPNIFGGQDCIGPEGRSSSTPNVFGGYDTTFPDGSRSSSHPNVFGDEDTTTPKGLTYSTSTSKIAQGDEIIYGQRDVEAVAPNGLLGRKSRQFEIGVIVEAKFRIASSSTAAPTLVRFDGSLDGLPWSWRR
jgi:hypothetical protein